MKDLDLSLVKIAQSNSALAKKEYLNISEEEKQEIKQRFYQNSVQTPTQNKKQQIHGKTYAGNIGKTVAFVTAGIAAVIITIKTAAIYTEISYYNDILGQKIENELTDKQTAAYERDHDNAISNVIEAYQRIEAAKDSLNPDDYNLGGMNITNQDTQYMPFARDTVITVDEKSQDAVDAATDEVISEYKRRG